MEGSISKAISCVVRYMNEVFLRQERNIKRRKKKNILKCILIDEKGKEGRKYK